MSALEILRKNTLASEGNFSYEERELKDDLVAVEIVRNGETKIQFREFYFIVDVVKEAVHLVDYSEPESVLVEKIKRGISKPFAQSK
jgi:hypothetical protein